jgi:predicted RNA-binding protein with PIN domain
MCTPDRLASEKKVSACGSVEMVCVVANDEVDLQNGIMVASLNLGSRRSPQAEVLNELSKSQQQVDQKSERHRHQSY